MLFELTDFPDPTIIPPLLKGDDARTPQAFVADDAKESSTYRIHSIAEHCRDVRDDDAGYNGHSSFIARSFATGEAGVAGIIF